MRTIDKFRRGFAAQAFGRPRYGRQARLAGRRKELSVGV